MGKSKNFLLLIVKPTSVEEVDFFIQNYSEKERGKLNRRGIEQLTYLTITNYSFNRILYVSRY